MAHVAPAPAIAPIPQVLHFIWMGPRIELWQNLNVEKLIKANRGCQINIWLDAFSMAPPDVLREALRVTDPGHANAENPNLGDLALVNAYNNGRAIARTPAGFLQTIAMLRTARARFAQHLANFPGGITRMSPAIVQVQNLVEVWQKENAGLNIRIRWLDQECYPRWQNMDFTQGPTRGQPQTNLANWVYLELYVRQNFGCSGDMIRLQLLIDYPGVYSDHDDEFPTLHTPATTATFVGYRHAQEAGQPSTSFQAACLGHPFPIFYLDTILSRYENLLHHNYDITLVDHTYYMTAYNVGTNNYWALPREGDPGVQKSVALPFSPFSLATIAMTGPSALADALHRFAAQFGAPPPGSVAIQANVVMGAANSWERGAG